MSRELACRTTHPQIAAGPCPWCGQTVGGTETASAAWDLDRVRADLTDDGLEARRATLWNLSHLLPGVEPSLDLLNQALGAADAQLREDVTVALATAFGGKAAPEWLLARLEEAAARHPVELAARILLLGCYSRRRSEEARRRRTAVALWVIEHVPDSEVAGMPFSELDPRRDGPDFEEGRRLWLRQVEARPDDPRVIGNAASYLMLYDRTKAGELLRRCRSLEPGNPHWSHRLAHLYKLAMTGKDEAARRDWAAMARAELEQEQRLHRVESDRVRSLPDVALMALESGDEEAARRYAEEILATAELGNDGDPVHYGNQILGRIALRGGDVDGAKARLIASSRTGGSNVLRSFGPSMKLAAELLERGERDSVLEYLAACSSFWKMGADRIAKWSAQIAAGETPDYEFGWR